jgi:hypothetical protein
MDAGSTSVESILIRESNPGTSPSPSEVKSEPQRGILETQRTVKGVHFESFFVAAQFYLIAAGLSGLFYCIIHECFAQAFTTVAAVSPSPSITSN